MNLIDLIKFVTCFFQVLSLFNLVCAGVTKCRIALAKFSCSRSLFSAVRSTSLSVRYQQTLIKVVVVTGHCSFMFK